MNELELLKEVYKISKSPTISAVPDDVKKELLNVAKSYTPSKLPDIDLSVTRSLGNFLFKPNRFVVANPHASLTIIGYVMVGTAICSASVWCIEKVRHWIKRNQIPGAVQAIRSSSNENIY